MTWRRFDQRHESFANANPSLCCSFLSTVRTECEKSVATATPRELELRLRRDEILRETADLTSNVVQSLEQQHRYAQDTSENLHQQNVLLARANEKMRSMNNDLSSVVNEMNEIDAGRGCLCCSVRKKKSRSNSNAPPQPPNGVSADGQKQRVGVEESVTSMPELVENNEQEKAIVEELNQMRDQLLLFQDQVKTINRSFREGEEIVQQLGDETTQYMHAITTALSKAEHVLGRKFVAEKQSTARR